MPTRTSRFLNRLEADGWGTVAHTTLPIPASSQQNAVKVVDNAHSHLSNSCKAGRLPRCIYYQYQDQDPMLMHLKQVEMEGFTPEGDALSYSLDCQKRGVKLQECEIWFVVWDITFALAYLHYGVTSRTLPYISWSETSALDPRRWRPIPHGKISLENILLVRDQKRNLITHARLNCESVLQELEAKASTRSADSCLSPASKTDSCAEKADILSLGASMYQICYGYTPVEFEDSNIHPKLCSINQPRITIKEQEWQYSVALHWLMDKCLENDINERWDAMRLLREITTILNLVITEVLFVGRANAGAFSMAFDKSMREFQVKHLESSCPEIFQEESSDSDEFDD